MFIATFLFLFFVDDDDDGQTHCSSVVDSNKFRITNAIIVPKRFGVACNGRLCDEYFGPKPKLVYIHTHSYTHKVGDDDDDDDNEAQWQ